MNPKLTVMFENGSYTVWTRERDWVWHVRRLHSLEAVLNFVKNYDDELRCAEFNPQSEVVGVPA
jgi:hypothetical protein